MKKFTFSLHALFEIKKTLKEKAQADYAAAEAALDEAICVKVALDRIFLNENDKYQKKVIKGITAGDMEAHSIYFEELREMIATAESDVTRLQETVRCRQAALVEIFKEIKVLEKLRQKQYLEYLSQQEKQDAGAREDLLAFNITGKAAPRSGAETAS